MKNQWEKKVGDTIHGHYTVLEPDGSLRIVHYTADEKNGFNAVVKHEGPSYHPVTIPSSHTLQTDSYFATSPAPNKSKSKINKFTYTTPKPIIEEQPSLDTQSVNIEPEPEMEAIDAYLYIPSHHNTKNHQYELVSDDKYQHFVNYDGHDVPHNHKSTYTSIQPNLKIKHSQHEQPISYDLLTPVTIDLTQYDFDNYKQGGFVEPEIETGFKPVPKSKGQEALPNIPNTFTTNKKPITTPGLKTYASDSHRPHLRGPVIFPKRMDKDRIVQFSAGKNKKNSLRYRKHVSYNTEDY